MNNRDWHIWLAGLIDGEGCFVLSKGRTPRHLIPTPQFKLGMRLDDRPILEEIRDKLDMGAVYTRSSNTGPKSPKNGKPAAEWVVFKKTDIIRLVELLRHCPLRTRKAKDFYTWSQAVDAWSLMVSPRVPADKEVERQLLRDQMWSLKAKLESDRAYDDTIQL